MKKVVVWILVVLSLGMLFLRFGIPTLSYYFGYKPRAGIKVTSEPQAKVYLNNEQVGETPFKDEDLLEGWYDIKLESEQGAWQSKVKLNKGTVSVVNRELSLVEASSSGEVLTLSSGSGVTIISFPDVADVEIDGKTYGKTPLSIPDLEAGEHTFLISKEKYVARSVRALVPQGMHLTLNVDLALIPTQPIITLPDPQTDPETVVIENTPNGFLRIRSKPSTNSQEVGRVFDGDKLIVVEDGDDWIKVRLENGTEGYVSADYVKRQ